ncbi:MAG: WD40/YVTN/BNR-like repeat-containing protein [Gemmatimonadales bacterium]
MTIRWLTALVALGAAGPAAAQWTPQASPMTGEIRGLVALSPQVVWASGTGGRVLRTTDGGATWTIDTVPGAAKLDLRSIAPRDARRAVTASAGPAESGAAKIFGTDDGVHFSERFTTADSGVFLDAIAFWDDRHGIALSDPVHGALYLLRTDDGGTTWSRVPTGDAPPVLTGEASFAASGTCLTVQGSSNVWIATGGGARARIFRSTDRGKTWSVADTPIDAGGASSGAFSVAFSDPMHGVAVGGDYTKAKGQLANVALSSDGGRTWRSPTGPLPAGYMSGVAYLPGTAGRALVAVGLAGTARSIDGGESWTMVDTVAYNSVAFAARDAGWAAGPKGRIARWTPATPAKP